MKKYATKMRDTGLEKYQFLTLFQAIALIAITEEKILDKTKRTVSRINPWKASIYRNKN